MMMARKPAKCHANLTKSVEGVENGNSKLKRAITPSKKILSRILNHMDFFI